MKKYVSKAVAFPTIAYITDPKRFGQLELFKSVLIEIGCTASITRRFKYLIEDNVLLNGRKRNKNPAEFEPATSGSIGVRSTAVLQLPLRIQNHFCANQVPDIF